MSERIRRERILLTKIEERDKRIKELENELNKMIEYILKEELPHEKSWTYATELKERLAKEQ
jgi:hypothetical protein